LQVVVGPQITNQALFPAFVALLDDSEAEVRTAISTNLLKFCQTLSDDVRVTRVLAEVVPQIKKRVIDESQHCRSALAGVIMGLAVLLGKENTIRELLPLFLTLLKDEFSEVRLNIISNLDEVAKVIGIDQLSAALKPAINELAQHEQWRVRQAIIEHIPSVARQLGVEYFDAELCDLSLKWLEDKVSVVRRTAITNIKKVIEIFGIQWAIASGSILSKVLQPGTTAGCMARLGVVFTIESLIEICPAEVVANYLVPPLCNHLYTDKVANIRFNVAKALEQMLPHVSKAIFQAQIKGVLETMKRDSDGDVKYFSGHALAKAGTLGLV
jgi:serine/threonine-protein phosphatase 2A regulatory subunit A